jgi:hypothetical protein
MTHLPEDIMRELKSENQEIVRIYSGILLWIGIGILNIGRDLLDGEIQSEGQESRSGDAVAVESEREF